MAAQAPARLEEGSTCCSAAFAPRAVIPSRQELTKRINLSGAERTSAAVDAFRHVREVRYAGAMANTAETTVYKHLRLFPPDVVWLEATSSGSNVGGITSELRARADEGGPYYLVVDFAKMKTPDMDTQSREKAQKMIDPAWILGAVYINASMPVRLMIKVFNLAMFLVGKADFQSEFVADKDEAFKAVDRLRAERAKTA